MPGIGNAIGIPFKKGGGISWSTYWLTRTPSNLVLTVVSDTEIYATWTDAAAASDGLKIYISDDGGATYTYNQTVAFGWGNADITGLTTLTTYTVKLVAYRGVNESDAVTASAMTFNSSLIAGWRFDVGNTETDYFLNTVADVPIADATSHAAAVYFNGVTYIGFCGIAKTAGRDYDINIIKYTHATSTWSAPVKIAANPLTTGDLHGSPSLLIDSDGYIHVMFGAHVSAIQYSKSTNPEDITAWTAQASPATGTYPQLMQFSDDTIYFFYRQGADVDAGGDGTEWGYKTSTDGGATWSAFTEIISTGFAYAFFRKGVGDTIHCTFNKGTSDANRQNIYYLIYNGGWKDIAGNAVTAPVAPEQPTLLAHDSGTNWNVMPVPTFDSTNKVHVVFTEGVAANPETGGAGTFTYYHLKHNGTSWVATSLGVAGNIHSDYSSAIDASVAGVIDIYPVSGGTAASVGGNISHYRSTDGGATWKRLSVIRRGQMYQPVMVQDYTANAKLLFAQFRGVNTNAIGKIYLWGNSGFVKGTYATTPDIKGVFDLELVNTPTLTAGQMGNCYSFASASSEYGRVFADSQLSFNGGSPDKPFSVTLWINITGTATEQWFFAKATAASLEYGLWISGGAIYWQMIKLDGSSSIWCSMPFAVTNAWRFLCCTYTGGAVNTNLKIYLNAVESQDTVGGGGITGMSLSTAPLTIARRYVVATPRYTNGMIDDPKLWNKVLSVPEMTNVMNNVAGW